jgi:hypothetical protein
MDLDKMTHQSVLPMNCRLLIDGAQLLIVLARCTLMLKSVFYYFWETQCPMLFGALLHFILFSTSALLKIIPH